MMENGERKTESGGALAGDDRSAARRRRVWRWIGRAACAIVSRALRLAWAGFSVWFAFWVARLTVPEFFYGRGREIVLTEDAAVMMVGVLLAFLLLVREK